MHQQRGASGSGPEPTLTGSAERPSSAFHESGTPERNSILAGGSRLFQQMSRSADLRGHLGAGAAPEWFWTASKWLWPTRAGALCADALARVTARSAPALPTQVRALYTNARTLLLPTARRCAFRSRPCASPAQHTSRSLRVRVLQARCHRPGALRASRRSRASFRREGALQPARGTRRPSHWRRHAS